VNPCDSSLNINVGDFSLGFALRMVKKRKKRRGSSMTELS